MFYLRNCSTDFDEILYLAVYLSGQYSSTLNKDRIKHVEGTAHRKKSEPYSSFSCFSRDVWPMNCLNDVLSAAGSEDTVTPCELAGR
jgi:hypothetical protein